MATYTTSNKGNLAIEAHVWNIPINEAKKIRSFMKNGWRTPARLTKSATCAWAQ